MHRFTRRTLAAALAAMALSAPTALAQSTDLRTPDARDAGSSQVSERAPATDQRSPDARVPSATPVVVEIEKSVGGGFDWTAAIIGLGAGLALAILAGVGVAGGRRRPVRSSMG